MSSCSSATAYWTRPAPRVRCSARHRLQEIVRAQRQLQRRGVRGRDLHRRVEPRRRGRGIRRSDDRRAQGERGLPARSESLSASSAPARVSPMSRQALCCAAPNTSCMLNRFPCQRLARALRHAAVCVLGGDDSRALSDVRPGFCGQIQHTICYSVKANSNLSILRMLARLGAGFDIVSGGELQRVQAADKKAPARLSSPASASRPRRSTLRCAPGILLFNVESASELELLAARAAHLRKRRNFAVRVNPDVAANTHPYISTGLHEHKFGVPWRDAAELYRQERRRSICARRA